MGERQGLICVCARDIYIYTERERERASEQERMSYLQSLLKIRDLFLQSDILTNAPEKLLLLLLELLLLLIELLC
jgi:hypothetical protein